MQCFSTSYIIEESDCSQNNLITRGKISLTYSREVYDDLTVLDSFNVEK